VLSTAFAEAPMNSSHWKRAERRHRQLHVRFLSEGLVFDISLAVSDCRDRDFFRSAMRFVIERYIAEQ
jgi:hypothetical protein